MPDTVVHALVLYHGSPGPIITSELVCVAINTVPFNFSCTFACLVTRTRHGAYCSFELLSSSALSIVFLRPLSRPFMSGFDTSLELWETIFYTRGNMTFTSLLMIVVPSTTGAAKLSTIPKTISALESPIFMCNNTVGQHRPSSW